MHLQTSSIMASSSSLNSPDHSLEVHISNRLIIASKCVCKIAQSWPWMHLSVRLVSGIKCIPKHGLSQPPSASFNSLCHGLQVCVSTRSITASKCISQFIRSQTLSESPELFYHGVTWEELTPRYSPLEVSRICIPSSCLTIGMKIGLIQGLVAGPLRSVTQAPTLIRIKQLLNSVPIQIYC